MNERGHYGNRRNVRLAGTFDGLFERPVLTDAVMALSRRAQQLAWQSLVANEGHGTPNAWLYTTSADVSKDRIEAIGQAFVREELRDRMQRGKVGFWAILAPGASAPTIVDVGVADAAVPRLANSPLIH
jgi:hypothetical protein